MSVRACPATRPTCAPGPACSRGSTGGTPRPGRRPRSEYQRHRIQVLIRMGARPARGRARESCYGVRRAVPLRAAARAASHAAGAGFRERAAKRKSAARAGPRAARRARHNKPTEKTLNGVYPHVPLAHRDRLSAPRGVRATARGSVTRDREVFFRYGIRAV